MSDCDSANEPVSARSPINESPVVAAVNGNADHSAESVTEATKGLSMVDTTADSTSLNESTPASGQEGEQPVAKKTGADVAASNEDKKIFVGGISAETTNEDLLAHFSQYGAVHAAQVKYDRITGRSRGFAFVEFTDTEPCRKALAQREQTLKAKTIEVKPAKSRENKKVFVGGLPADFGEDKLRAHFERFGHVDDIEWPFDRQRNVRRNFAFIVFDTEEAADAASQDLKQTFGDRECDVKKAVPQSRRLNPLQAMHQAGMMHGYGHAGAYGQHAQPPYMLPPAAYGRYAPPPPPPQAGRGGQGQGGQAGRPFANSYNSAYSQQAANAWSSAAQAWTDWYGAAAQNASLNAPYSQAAPYGQAYNASQYGQAYGYGSGAGQTGSDYWTSAAGGGQGGNSAGQPPQSQNSAGGQAGPGGGGAAASVAGASAWGGTFDAYAPPAGGRSGGGNSANRVGAGGFASNSAAYPH